MNVTLYTVVVRKPVRVLATLKNSCSSEPYDALDC